MKELRLNVDRVEEGVAVCYAPDGDGMIDVTLPAELCGAVRDGAVILVRYDGDAVASVELCGDEDTGSAERRARLDRLFGRK